MQCSKCGKEIANDSIFCEYCGTKVKTSKSKIPFWIVLAILLALCIYGGSFLADYYLFNQKEEPVAEQPKDSVSEQKTYILQHGDFLAKISHEVYGTADSVNAIIRLNKITNPDSIEVGTVLLMP